MISRRQVGIYVTAASVALCLFGLSAKAHVGHFVLTTITWNADVSALEVVHRIHARHAQKAAAIQLDDDGASFDDLKILAALGLYTELNFAIAALDDTVIPLNFIGAELQGDYVVIYQEAALRSEPRGLKIRNDLLTDVFNEQVNQVNVTLEGDIKTLTFRDHRRGEYLSTKDAL